MFRIILTLAVLIFAFPTFAQEPDANAVASSGIDALIIPSLDIAVPLVICHIEDRSWNTDEVWEQACLLEGMANPGQGNTGVAGHLDYKNGGPAVFFDLPRIPLGSNIHVYYEDMRYDYYVVSKEAVHYEDTSVLFASENKLTLLTSYGTYREDLGRYNQVMVVVAMPLFE